MAPDVIFTLSMDSYNRYEILLSEQNVKVRPLSRETLEELANGRLTVAVRGLLSQGEYEFGYAISKAPDGKCFLSLEPYTHGPDAAKAILAALEAAFPQPERGLLKRPAPERPVSPRSFITRYGCLLFIILIIAICVFAVIGVVSLFK